MKNVTFRLTDKQHYYLTKLAKQEKRSIEHLMWMLIPSGINDLFAEQTYYLEKLQCDFTEEDEKSMKEFSRATPSWGSDYYGPHPWSDAIADNVLENIEGTLESTDEAFDLEAEIQRTTALHAKRRADAEAEEKAAQQVSEPEGN